MKSISYSISPTELIARYKMNMWLLFINMGLVILSVVVYLILINIVNLEINFPIYYLFFFVLPLIVPIMFIRSGKEFNESLEMGWNIQIDDNQLIINRGHERDILSWSEINKVMTLEQYRRRNNKVPYNNKTKHNTLVVLPRNVINNLIQFKKLYILLPTLENNCDQVMDFINLRINNP